MSICTNFEGALMKAIRSLEQHVDSLMSYEFGHLTDEELMQVLHRVDDRRIFVIAEAIRRGISQDTINFITKIDPVSYTHLDVYKRQPDCPPAWI